MSTPLARASAKKPASPSRVAVCVVTRRRPEGLRRALRSLDEILVKDPTVEVRIVVVENEIAGEAKRVLEDRTGGRFPVVYAVEPIHGIPFARNRAVEVAGDVDFIAFLDDDEWAEPQWLEELLDAQARSGAQVVFGPVLPEFEAHPPKWLVRSRYFDPLSFKALQEVGFAYTSNVLVWRGAFDSDRPFPEKFAVIGGSDTHFFMRVWLAGGRIVWAPGARVHEAIPPQRMRLGWIARREYRRGTTLSLCLLDLEPFPHRKVKRVVHGVGRIAFGAVLALASVVRGRGLFARAVSQAAFGAGLLIGLTGRGYPEYRDKGGSEPPR